MEQVLCTSGFMGLQGITQAATATITWNNNMPGYKNG